MKNENVIIGIDLGTTNSLAAVFRDGEAKILRLDDSDSGIVPSVVRFENEDVFVGNEALKRLALSSQGSTFFSAKRFFGKTFLDVRDSLKDLPFEVFGDEKSLWFSALGKKVFPFEISSYVLRAIKTKARSVLGFDVTRAVITVPAYFDDAQRNETRAAARAAGLEVERIINEPTAAAIAYGLDTKKQGKVAVYDLGGGTFDVSVLDLQDGVFKVLSTSGDTYLGGDDFDQKIVDWMFAEKKKIDPSFTPTSFLRLTLKYAAEEIKKRLSFQEEVPVEIEMKNPDFSFHQILKRQTFEEWILPLVKKTLRCCKKALKDAQIENDEITQVVLVGGSTRIPSVRQEVRNFFEKTPFIGLNPDEVVALGAAVQAQILSGGQRDVLLLDVIPLSLGIETLGGAVTKIMLRNTTIPVEAEEDFTTSVDNQTVISVHVLQGERELVEDCRSLGRFRVKIPPMQAGYPKLKVKFLIDENGMLSVSAFEERSGSRAGIEINPSIGLSREEMDRIVEDSIMTAIEDFSLRMVVELRNKAQRILVALDKVWEDAKSLIDPQDAKEVEFWAQKAKEALSRNEKDQQVLEEIVETLGNLTRPVADVIFNKATQDALVGKQIKEV